MYSVHTSSTCTYQPVPLKITRSSHFSPSATHRFRNHDKMNGLGPVDVDYACCIASDFSDESESGRVSSISDDSAMTMRVMYTPDAIAHKLAHWRRSISNLEIGGDEGPMAELVVDDESISPATPSGSPSKMQTHRPTLSLVVSSPGSERQSLRLGRVRPLSIAAPLVSTQHAFAARRPFLVVDLLHYVPLYRQSY